MFGFNPKFDTLAAAALNFVSILVTMIAVIAGMTAFHVFVEGRPFSVTAVQKGLLLSFFVAFGVATIGWLQATFLRRRERAPLSKEHRLRQKRER